MIHLQIQLPKHGQARPPKNKDISQAANPKGFKASKKVAAQGGNVAKVAIKELKVKTGKKVVTGLNTKFILPETKVTKKLNPKKPKM